MPDSNAAVPNPEDRPATEVTELSPATRAMHNAGHEPGEGEEPEAAAHEGEEGNESEAGERKRKPGWVRERERRERAEQERDFWRDEAMRNRSTQPKEDSSPAQPKPEEELKRPVRPRMEQFDSVAEYEAALDKYEEERDEYSVKRAERTVQEREKAARTRSEEDAVIGRWRERAQTVREANPDFDDAVQAVDKALPTLLRIEIAKSEIGPEIALYLGTNEREAARIAALPPASALKELGKIEERLARENSQEKEGKASAPAQTKEPIRPTTPIRRASARPDDGELRDDLSPEEWAKRFRKKREA